MISIEENYRNFAKFLSKIFYFLLKIAFCIKPVSPSKVMDGEAIRLFLKKTRNVRPGKFLGEAISNISKSGGAGFAT